MDDRVKLAIASKQHATQQIITFSAGILTVTTTFAQNLLRGAPEGTNVFLILAWISFLMSVFFGLWTLHAITGTIEPIGLYNENQLGLSFPISIRGKNIAVPSILQILLFTIGLSALCYVGIQTYASVPVIEPTQKIGTTSGQGPAPAKRLLYFKL